jgi:hypothetical protein
VKYTDGSGDLGGGRAEVHDCRGASIVTALVIPPIASEEGVSEGVSIEGELNLLVADIGASAGGGASSVCTESGAGGPSGEALPFCVILVDKGGERSEGACTAPIRIVQAAK